MTTSDIMSADDHPKLRELRERCLDQLVWLALGEGDAVDLVDQILEQVVKALRKEPWLPMLSLAEWDLVLADVRARAEDQLTRAIDGKASISQTVECVIEIIFTEKVSAS